MTTFQNVLANKHTTGAAAVYVGAAFITGLGTIWLPQHKEQFESTAKLLETLAVGYGFLLSGDAKPINGNHETKPPTPSDTPTAT